MSNFSFSPESSNSYSSAEVAQKLQHLHEAKVSISNEISSLDVKNKASYKDHYKTEEYPQYQNPFWKNIIHIIVMLLVGLIEWPLNEAGFQTFRIAPSKTKLLAYGFALVVSLLAEFTGYCLKRGSVKKWPSGVGIFSTGILLAVISFVGFYALATLRMEYLTEVGKSTGGLFGQMFFPVMLFCVGVGTAAWNASSRLDLEWEKKFHFNNKKIHALRKNLWSTEEKIRTIELSEAKKKDRLKNPPRKSFLSRLFSAYTLVAGLVILSAVSCSEKNNKPIETAVEILVDNTEKNTDNRSDLLPSTVVLEMIGITKSDKVSCSINCTPMTNVHNTKTKHFKFSTIPQDGEEEPNPLVVMETKKKFQDSLAKFLTSELSNYTEGTKSSDIFSSIAQAIERLKKSNLKHKKLIIISDLVENSEVTDFYKIPDQIDSTTFNNEHKKLIRGNKNHDISENDEDISIMILFDPKGSSKAQKDADRAWGFWEKLFTEKKYEEIVRQTNAIESH